MEPAIRYRAADQEDVAWLTETFVTVLHDAIAETRGSWDELRERDQFVRQLRLTDSRVVLVAGVRAGFYTAWPAPDHWLLGTLCVTAEHQNRGLGAAIMQEIARQARGQPVQLSVLRSNRAARRFYERLGCQHVSSTEHHDHLLWPSAAPSE